MNDKNPVSPAPVDAGEANLVSAPVETGEYTTMEWMAVSGPENAEWSHYTPSGSLKLNVRSEIADKYEVGKMYYVDITEVTNA